MKKVLVVLVMSLSLFSCLPADEKIIECEPIVLEGMFYSYDKSSGDIKYSKHQVNYFFVDGTITVRDARFLIFRGTYYIKDGVLIATSNIKNMVYDEYDTIEIQISLDKGGKSFSVANTWTWFITSSEVRGDFKFIYK
jgi:hypothetical protein